ncbi:hypothetical protein [uncultured Chloroflexus sp.]|uniref:hypothetical protein n=1 Tax=uncultured Chloroflexus sp. TaxID=214040 RepID=UPI00262DEC08|nr:hypothetical protein [uncultured Chloroflexus sp.]
MMARSRPILPLSVILVGLTFVFWVSLSTSPNASQAQPSCDEKPAYPGCIEIPVDCGSYPANVCDVTKTAIITTRTAAAAQAFTRTALVSGQQGQQFTATPTATVTVTGSPISSTTATATPTVTQPLINTQLPTNTPLPTPSPTTSMEPTATAAVALRCAPGDLLELTGEANPQTALLVLFDDRPVGGGASDRSGSFHIVLRIGDERPGVHDIVVRERERAVVVAEYTCQTPSPPTPTPTFGPIRVTVTP